MQLSWSLAFDVASTLAFSFLMWGYGRTAARHPRGDRWRRFWTIVVVFAAADLLLWLTASPVDRGWIVRLLVPAVAFVAAYFASLARGGLEERHT